VPDVASLVDGLLVDVAVTDVQSNTLRLGLNCICKFSSPRIHRKEAIARALEGKT